MKVLSKKKKNIYTSAFIICKAPPHGHVQSQTISAQNSLEADSEEQAPPPRQVAAVFLASTSPNTWGQHPGSLGLALTEVCFCNSMVAKSSLSDGPVKRQAGKAAQSLCLKQCLHCQCGSVGWGSFCKAKGHWFDSRSGHVLGLWAWSVWLGRVGEATDGCFSH